MNLLTTEQKLRWVHVLLEFQIIQYRFCRILSCRQEAISLKILTGWCLLKLKHGSGSYVCLLCLGYLERIEKAWTLVWLAWFISWWRFGVSFLHFVFKTFTLHKACYGLLHLDRNITKEIACPSKYFVFCCKSGIIRPQES